jgi:hypothetical protein
MPGISLLNKELLASQEGIIFLQVDIVIVIVPIHRSVMISTAVTWLLVL